MPVGLFGADLSAPLLVIWAPNGIRPLWIMAGTSPVPLAATTQRDVHAQHPLDADFSPVRPARPQFPALKHFNLVLKSIIIIQILLKLATLFVHPALNSTQIGNLSRVQSYLSGDAA